MKKHGWWILMPEKKAWVKLGKELDVTMIYRMSLRINVTAKNYWYLYYRFYDSLNICALNWAGQDLVSTDGRAKRKPDLIVYEVSGKIMNNKINSCWKLHRFRWDNVMDPCCLKIPTRISIWFQLDTWNTLLALDEILKRSWLDFIII